MFFFFYLELDLTFFKPFLFRSRAKTILNTGRRILNDDSHCLKCTTKWTDQQYTLHIKPKQTRKKKAADIVNMKNAKQSLTSSQEILYKKYNKSINPIAVKCISFNVEILINCFFFVGNQLLCVSI